MFIQYWWVFLIDCCVCSIIISSIQKGSADQFGGIVDEDRVSNSCIYHKYHSYRDSGALLKGEFNDI